MPNLYVVATPIGNLEDISLRALRVLREVRLIAAEDTRKTKRLLNAYDIQTPMTSYHEHNEKTKLDYILNSLKEGDVALVSEAGMPGVSAACPTSGWNPIIGRRFPWMSIGFCTPWPIPVTLIKPRCFIW